MKHHKGANIRRKETGQLRINPGVPACDATSEEQFKKRGRSPHAEQVSQTDQLIILVPARERVTSKTCRLGNELAARAKPKQLIQIAGHNQRVSGQAGQCGLTPCHSTAALCLPEYTDRPPRPKGVNGRRPHTKLKAKRKPLRPPSGSNGSFGRSYRDMGGIVFTSRV